MLDKYGPDWADKPVGRGSPPSVRILMGAQNDYLTWTMEEDIGDLVRDPGYLVLRILDVNFASIHTSNVVSYF
jgi:hypothetical protein